MIHAKLPMASSSFPILFLLFFFFFFFSTQTRPSNSQPTALVLPISKDLSTHRYTARINQRTPLVPIDVALDLSGNLLWISRDANYRSSSYLPTSCNSTQCSTARRTKNPKCATTTCNLTTTTAFSDTLLTGNLSTDTLTLHSTNGLNPTSMVTTPFLFASTPQDLDKDTGSHGIAGLGRSSLALPSQLAMAFNFPKVFAVCLPPSTEQGVLFFGDGPYAFTPGIDVSKLLAYTPLIPAKGYQYRIGVTSIQVNGRKVKLNSSTISTGISTVNQYTTMESSIYRSFTKTFGRAAKAGNLTRAESRPPFEYCYMTRTSSGYRSAMPAIDLVMQSDEVFWRMFETNSMVSVEDDVACLGFVDGGSDPKGAAMVIGGRQLEDNLLQFDLESSRLGFTSTLLLRQTSCSNFNFTPSA